MKKAPARELFISFILAGRGGFEPPLADPESAVLPLDDLPTHLEQARQNIFYHKNWGCQWSESVEALKKKKRWENEI